MNIYFILIAILLLVFFFYCHIYQFIKESNHYEILQAGNPSPDNLEKMFLEKSPIVITDLLGGWDGFNQIDFEYIKVQPDLTKDKVVIKLLDKYSKNYLLPFKISHSYNNNISRQYIESLLILGISILTNPKINEILNLIKISNQNIKDYININNSIIINNKNKKYNSIKQEINNYYTQNLL